MTYSIIGTGSVGKALARQFARSGITVGIANTRGPESIVSMAKELGDKVATNAYGVPLADLDNLPSSAIVAKALPGAHLVKAFNHLPAGVLAQDPATAGGRRVIFLSGDDEGATATVAALVETLGYAPVSLGKIAEGGQLVQARDKSWAPLIFQDLFKKEK
jgi:8-hydroxy-5-deazaflavin:NADPH oxidoreductase